MERYKINKTRQYIERLITIHQQRINPKGLEGLSEIQNKFYEIIETIAQNNHNQVLTNQIREEYQIRHGKLNLLPTDFCYNLVNVGPDFKTKFLINIERRVFKFVDFHWRSDDSETIITWTPKGKNVPLELRGENFTVGKYYKGEYRWNFSELDEYL